MKKICIIAATIAIVFNTMAQQDPMYTHYAFNTLAVNPAYAGSRDVMTITGLHRSQWVGFDGAPITQTLTYHSPVFNKVLGMGVSLLQDKIGPVRFTTFYGDLSYRFNASKNTRISLGIKGGGSLMQGDIANLLTIDQGDADLQNVRSKFLPNVGVGLYIFNPKWYLGLSAPKVIQNTFTTNSIGALKGEQRHYFFIAGMVNKLSSSVKLKPTMFIKATESAPVEGDLTAMLIFNDKYEIGLMGRTGDALGILLGYNINSQLRIGYSFDWSFENITGRYNWGSHEIMVRYDIVNLKPNKIYSPRYF